MHAVTDTTHLYEVERRARHAERDGFRISELQISPTQKVPWHYHSNVQDTFYVLEGTIRVFITQPGTDGTTVSGTVWFTIWLENARFQSGPRSSGATASPYGRWRALSTIPPSTAASGVPPDAIVATARNCEPPAKITSDMAQVITSESPLVRASTPNESPITT